MFNMYRMFNTYRMLNMTINRLLPGPCTAQVRIVYSEMASSKDQPVRTAAGAPPKSQNRDVAERSVINAMGLLVAVGASHFVPGDPTKQRGPVTEFQRRTMDAFGGADLVPLPANQLMNQDETTMVVSLGDKKQGSTARYVQLAPASQSNRRQSDYANPEHVKVAASKYLRIKKYTMFTGGGECTTPFLSISGRSEREMPICNDGEVDDGIVYLRFPAMVQNAHKNPLARSASATSATAAAGIIIFSRSTSQAAEGKVGESAEGKVARYHKELVANPFIEAIQTANGHVPGTAYEPSNTVVLYRDGCGPALVEDLRPDSLAYDKSRRIRQIKGNPSATATQQCNDVVDWYRSEKRMEKSSVPEGQYELRLADQIYETIMNHPRLNLKSQDARCIANYGSLQSRLEEQSNTATKTIDTFCYLGYLDAATKTTPDPAAMLSNTTRSTITMAQRDEFWQLYPELVREFDELGRNPESTWKAVVANSATGIPPDTTSAGKVVWRDKGVTSMSEQRVQRIGADNVVAERAAIAERKLAAQRKKVEDAATKVNGTLTNAALCEAKLASLSNGPFTCAAVEHFVKVGAPLLQDFILSRTLTGPRPRGHPALPPKRKLAEAKSALDGTGDPTLVSMAYSLRNSPVTAVAPAVPAWDPAAVPAAAARPALPEGTTVAFGGGNVHAQLQRATSDLLRDTEWLSRLGDSMYFSDAYGTHDTDGDRGDSACRVMLQRLQLHVARTLPGDKKRQANQCWTFAAENLSRVVATFEAGGMLKRDMSTVLSVSCLLRHPDGQWILSANADPNLEGAYGYWDKELGRWVRCGKVSGAGRTIRVRHTEHATGSKLLTNETRGSSFYRGYPDRGDEAASGKPSWQDLQCYVVVGFRRADARAIAAICDESESGLFVWSKSTLAAMRRCKFTSAAVEMSMDNKKLNMVSYLYETAAQLACSPDHNLSRSPSFEALLGVFGASDA